MGVFDDRKETRAVRSLAEPQQLAVFEISRIFHIFSHVSCFHQAIQHRLPILEEEFFEFAPNLGMPIHIKIRLIKRCLPRQLDSDVLDKARQPRQVRQKLKAMYAVHRAYANVLPDTAIQGVNEVALDRPIFGELLATHCGCTASRQA